MGAAVLHGGSGQLFPGLMKPWWWPPPLGTNKQLAASAWPERQQE